MFVDPHTHHFMSNHSTLELIKNEGFRRVFILAYMPVRPLHHTTLVDLFRWLVEVEPIRFRDLGIELRVGLGIHPRNIPLSGSEGLAGVMEEWLIKADFVGEVGLETCSDEEVRVLSEMLRLAKKLDKVVIVHTPRKGKELVVKKLPKYLELSGIQLERVVVDHVSREVVGELLKYGVLVGLTVQLGKLNVEDVVDLVLNYPELVDRGLINSDCGRDPSDPLAVKKAYEALLSSNISKTDAMKLVNDNALRLVN